MTSIHVYLRVWILRKSFKESAKICNAAGIFSAEFWLPYEFSSWICNTRFLCFHDPRKWDTTPRPAITVFVVHADYRPLPEQFSASCHKSCPQSCCGKAPREQSRDSDRRRLCIPNPQEGVSFTQPKKAFCIIGVADLPSSFWGQRCPVTLARALLASLFSFYLRNSDTLCKWRVCLNTASCNCILIPRQIYAAGINHRGRGVGGGLISAFFGTWPFHAELYGRCLESCSADKMFGLCALDNASNRSN